MIDERYLIFKANSTTAKLAHFHRVILSTVEQFSYLKLIHYFTPSNQAVCCIWLSKRENLHYLQVKVYCFNQHPSVKRSVEIVLDGSNDRAYGLKRRTVSKI